MLDDLENEAVRDAEQDLESLPEHRDDPRNWFWRCNLCKAFEPRSLRAAFSHVKQRSVASIPVGFLLHAGANLQVNLWVVNFVSGISFSNRKSGAKYIPTVSAFEHTHLHITFASTVTHASSS